MLRLLLIVLLPALWFGGLDHRRLFDPDEGRYAEVAREMLAGGDPVTPRLHGFKHLTKPPLQYWMTALAYRAFGVDEWTSRLWSAVSGMLAILVAAFTMRRLHGTQAAFASAAVLASGVLFVLFSQVGIADMGLTLFLTTSLCAIMLGLDTAPGSRAERRWMLLAWICMGLGMLTKGLVGALFPLLVAALYALSAGDRHLWRRLHPLAGAALLLAVAAPWFVAVSLRTPEFPAFFFLEEHLARFAGSGHRREKPVWFFVALVLAGLLPWTWAALEGVREGWRDARGGFRSGRFLVLWAVAIVLFFTLSRAKMPAYVLPAFPALAMLAGQRLARLDAGAIARRVLPLLALAGLAMASAGWLVPRNASPQAYRVLFEHYAPWLHAAAAVALGTSLVLGALRPARAYLIGAAALASLAAIQLCILGLETLSPLRSSHALARAIDARAGPDTRVFMVGLSSHTLPFYLGRDVVLAQETGQMAFGVRLEPQRALLEPVQFWAAWSAAPSAIALLDQHAYEGARAAGLAMEVLCRDRQRTLVIRPDAEARTAAAGPPPDCVLEPPNR